ncbi:TPA: signal recognition particle-docking protein FtsY [Aeromonas salmonicida]|uniref:signal recognition particle-docking protein FtsY n=1 Tax=Aeromonas salmonicida TaxID=645 RepID=UPI0003606072|nr:signal recognition particle-docking protein FtsY [Aeromonas salmonicida]ASI24902.1 signal recognition particle-docking protein FtsY [Aeromonas salmonicida]ASI29221.1 signal recognition particle-docking protein FtsY [Aeromonas salmonicida]ASI33353.1 signal recognition particle-docking protein FtsY [Aeromonas salmonicida]ATD36918.1 signal recognition particle-docking protein FtsY [Aeromonas salmonicida subsp. masoucida]ELI6417303.1 signal recognition particle-docking protein FtsY [Aeromonas s
MAKGLFSWLGFGRKKEEAEAVQPQTPQATPVTAEPEVTASPAPVSDTTPVVVHELPASAQNDALHAGAPLHDDDCPPTELDVAPLVVEECASELEPVIVNELLIEQARVEAQAVETARVAAEAQAAEAARVAAEAQAAEAARVAAEAQVAEAARVAAEAQVAEAARIVAEAQAAEAARVAAEAQAVEAARVAAEAQAAEVARVAAEAQAAEAARVAAEAQVAEAARVAAEAQAAEAARVAAEVQAAEAARVAAEAQAAEAARLAAEAQAAEAARIAAEAQAAEEARIAKEAQRAEDLRLVAEMEAEAAALAALPLAAKVDDDTQDKPQREGFFARLKRSLVRTKENIGSGFFGLFSGKKIDDDLFEELETQLLTADLGVDTTRRIIDGLVQHADRKQLKDAEALYGLLKQDMGAMLAQVEQPLVIDTSKKPYVILMVGVNGVGKTTTIGKLAKQFQAEGKSVMLAAGDTFRAAAVEQLQVWGQRNNIPVIAQHTGADSASVIYDAIEAARSRGADVLIADTAGRLQNKSNLMEELKKVVRVMKKLDEEAPHEIMLTLDAGTGQNALSQAKLFSEAVGLDGIVLTKLDGTAKGGVIFAVADKFQIPIRYIGVGEGIDDLRPFVANDFIEALFSREE